MWNNKRIKVHETYCISCIKPGDIITVEMTGVQNKGRVLTVNGTPIESIVYNFPADNSWEALPDFEIGKWYSFKAYNSDNIIKVSSITSYISGTPWILEKEYNSTGAWPSDACSEIKELKVEDECIQSVLPEGHEDKILLAEVMEIDIYRDNKLKVSYLVPQSDGTNKVSTDWIDHTSCKMAPNEFVAA